MHGQTIDGCVEAICARGCSEVRKVIGVLEQGGHVEETAALSRPQREVVLGELQAIMAVYDVRPTGR